MIRTPNGGHLDPADLEAAASILDRCDYRDLAARLHAAIAEPEQCAAVVPGPGYRWWRCTLEPGHWGFHRLPPDAWTETAGTPIAEPEPPATIPADAVRAGVDAFHRGRRWSGSYPTLIGADEVRAILGAALPHLNPSPPAETVAEPVSVMVTVRADDLAMRFGLKTASDTEWYAANDRLRDVLDAQRSPDDPEPARSTR